MSRETDFKQELKELLQKYEASISFSCSDCSDTYGIYDGRIEVDIREPSALGRKYSTYRLSDGWGVDVGDL